MEEILTTDYSQQVIGKVNTNFGSVVVSADDCATEATAAMNTAFAGTSGVETLSPADYADDFVETLNDNFDLYDDEPQPEDVTFRFLHVSDPHGYKSATDRGKQMLDGDNGLQFLFITGDMTAYNNTLPSGLETSITAIGDKLLMLPGNHDTYDNKFGTSAVSQQATTNYIKGKLGNRVTWGDQTGVASYWHKDFTVNGHTLRIISLDQYEIDRQGKSYNYLTRYTQAQVDWLIGLLSSLTANDYVIIAMHEPPVQSPSGTNETTVSDPYARGLEPTQPYFTNGVLNEPQKLFVSERVWAFGNRYYETDLNLLPRIMRAYMHKQSLDFTYNNYNGTSSVHVEADFSQNDPATFLFFLGGHRHADICTYLPDETQAGGGDWSDQLMLYITCGDVGINYQYDDDLGGTASSVTPKPTNTYSYRINEVELNFTKQTIMVTREGACNTAGGRVRSSVTFPFAEEGGES